MSLLFFLQLLPIFSLLSSFVAAQPITSSGTLENIISSSNSALSASASPTESNEPIASQHGHHRFHHPGAHGPGFASHSPPLSTGAIVFFGILGGILAIGLVTGLVHSCWDYWRTPSPDRIKIVVDRFKIQQEMRAANPLHRNSSLLEPPPPPYFPAPPTYKRNSDGSSIPPSPATLLTPIAPQNDLNGQR